jgi:hypothetical protein
VLGTSKTIETEFKFKPQTILAGKVLENFLLVC